MHRTSTTRCLGRSTAGARHTGRPDGLAGGRYPAAGTGNTVDGGNFYAPVLQGRDIQATFRLPTAAPIALALLPPEVAGFTGRVDELAVLAERLDPAGPGGPVVVSALAGLARVGKTFSAPALTQDHLGERGQRVPSPETPSHLALPHSRAVAP
jgi:hypothetical protein